MNEMHVIVAGEGFQLHVERAVFWSRRRCLMVADVHFGKGAVLRRAGITVPTGQTARDLARLDGLIACYRPTQLVVLGDLVHGAAPPNAPWIDLVNAWREQHADIAMTLIAGNHDRHFDARKLGFEIIDDALTLDRIVLRHTPDAVADHYVLCGHMHPGVALRDGWRRHRLPAFRFGARLGVLPAFGTLTGLHETPREPRESIVAVTPGGLVEVV